MTQQELAMLLSRQGRAGQGRAGQGRAGQPLGKQQQVLETAMFEMPQTYVT